MISCAHGCGRQRVDATSTTILRMEARATVIALRLLHMQCNVNSHAGVRMHRSSERESGSESATKSELGEVASHRIRKSPRGLDEKIRERAGTPHRRRGHHIATWRHVETT